MAKARMYGWSEKRFEAPKRVAELKGQAKVVADTLDAMHNEAHDAGNDTPRFLAQTVADRVAADGKLVTRQDVLRVTLYYLLILKKRGFVAAAEAPVETDAVETTETETADITE